MKAKIDQNALPLTDDQNKIHRLVSSVAIAHVLVSHKVRLEPEWYMKLLSSLILVRDPEEQSCDTFRKLLAHFPSEEQQ